MVKPPLTCMPTVVATETTVAAVPAQVQVPAKFNILVVGVEPEMVPAVVPATVVPLANVTVFAPIASVPAALNCKAPVALVLVKLILVPVITGGIIKTF